MNKQDRGFTLIEVLVTIVLLGIVMSAIAAAIIVVFRTDDGIVTQVSESHDTQQVVSYLPLDVESGPSRADAYRATSGGAAGDRGSGCLQTGNDNVLRIEVTDRRLDLVDRQIAYELVSSGSLASIDRLICEFDGTVWQETSRVNVADSLDATAGTVAAAEVIVADGSLPVEDQEVTSVVLRYAQQDQLAEIAASPREEQPLSSAGVCGPDPLSATRNIDTFIEGDVHLDGTTVKSSFYAGGSISFEGSPEVAQASPSSPTLPAPHSNVGLFAGSVDWAGSSGQLRVRNGTDLLVQDGNYVGPVSGPVTESGAGGPQISLSPGGQVVPPSGTDLPISPGLAFIELRACSDRLAGLPDTCNSGACADHVGLPAGYPGTATASGPQLDLDIPTAGLAYAFNIEEQNLLDLQTVQLNAPSSMLSDLTPLVINVGSTPGGTITFTPPKLSGSGTNAIYIIWNFPNAAVLNVVGSGGDQLRGTIMAPYSIVNSSMTIEGSVIATEFNMSGPALNDQRQFDGDFGW